MVKRILFLAPLAQTMSEYLAEIINPDVAASYTVWVFPAANVVSQTTT